MAINPFPRVGPLEIPAALPSAARAPEGTFNNIASIGDAIGAFRTHQQVAEAINAATDPATGNIDFDKATANLGKQGLVRYAEAFMQAGLRKQALGQTERELTERGRHNLATEEAMRTAKVPFGWTVGPEGVPTYTPGGPADPAYVGKLAELKQKPREFTMSDITKLSEEGGKFANVAGFGKTFEDRYAPGYMHPAIGTAVNTAGRYLSPDIVGKDVAESATWWQGYDRYKQVVRNELYGASLQPNEQRDFEKADINPGMDPKQIRKNLDIQKNIVGNGLKRKANAAIASGYSPDAISKAYGLDLSELGVDASGRRGSVTPAAPATSAPGGVPPPPPGFIMR